MTLAIRQLRASITINPESSTPTFAGGKSNTVTFGGSGADALRMKVYINHVGGIDTTMHLTVYGLPISIMNQLSTMGMQLNLVPKNKIVVEAGDASSGMAQIFDGYIIGAYADFEASPEVAFHISAQCGIAFATIKGTPQSFQGSADVATIMSGLASQMNLKFENSGVTSKLSNSYLYGSPRDQMNTVAEHAGINAKIINGTLAIWPKNGSRGGQIVTLSPTSGLIGYPIYNAMGVLLRTLFNPSIDFGQKIKVEGSVLTAANGTYNIYGLDHDLECQAPNGKWESLISATNPIFPTPIVR
jgi:hypothetical protein